MKELFLKVKPSTVLLLLKDSQQAWYPSKLARASNSSYVHTVNLLSQLRKSNIVSLEKKGRQNYYKLTEKGAYLALSLDDFAKKCDAAGAEAKTSAEKAASAEQAALHPAQALEKQQAAQEKEKK
jgi:predicted transcriptional regulator